MVINNSLTLAKKTGKLFLARGIFYSGLLGLYLNLRKEKEVLILRYHRIFADNDNGGLYKLGINKTNFDKQIDYLKRHYQIVSLEQAVQILKYKAPIPDKAVVITFDDGYQDNWLNAYPVLARNNVPATIYITTKYIGTEQLFFWDRLKYIVEGANSLEVNVPLLKAQKFDLNGARQKKNAFYQILNFLKTLENDVKDKIMDELEKQLPNYPPESENDRLLSWEEIKKMSEGRISFGGHTLTHPLLNKISIKEAKFEVQESKKDIEKALGIPALTFAYPGGDLSGELKSLVKDAGYAAACSTSLGTNNHASDLYALNRKGVSDGTSTGWSGKFSKALFAVEMSGIFDKLFLRTLNK